MSGETLTALARLRRALDPHRGPADDPTPYPDGWLASVALILRGTLQGSGGQGSGEGARGHLDLDALELLLIRRAANERDPWSGQMALPGGRHEPGDVSLVHTARRETAEEVGIRLSATDDFLGRLEVVAPRNASLPPLTVVPMVFAVAPGTHGTVHSVQEVAELLWVPVGQLRDPASRTTYRYPPAGDLAFPAFDVGGRSVWGLTHRILSDFLDRTR